MSTTKKSMSKQAYDNELQAIKLRIKHLEEVEVNEPSIYEQATKVPSDEELRKMFLTQSSGKVLSETYITPVWLRASYRQGNVEPTREKAEQVAAKKKALTTIRRYVELVNDSEVNDGLCSMFVRISEYETVTFTFTDESSMNQFRKDCAQELAILMGE